LLRNMILPWLKIQLMLWASSGRESKLELLVNHQ
jgi:hypothetical protein